MKPPLTPAQRTTLERDLLAEHGPRTLAGEPRLSRSDEQTITDEVRAAETATNEQRLAEHLAQLARLTSELAVTVRSMREHNLIDRVVYRILDRDIRSLTTTRGGLTAGQGSRL